jgi:hypothetical protein
MRIGDKAEQKQWNVISLGAGEHLLFLEPVGKKQ